MKWTVNHSCDCTVIKNNLKVVETTFIQDANSYLFSIDRSPCSIRTPDRRSGVDVSMFEVLAAIHTSKGYDSFYIGLHQHENLLSLARAH